MPPIGEHVVFDLPICQPVTPIFQGKQEMLDSEAKQITYITNIIGNVLVNMQYSLQHSHFLQVRQPCPALPSGNRFGFLP